MLRDADERTIHDVVRGRLALALVSARAELCSNKACGRERLCLARFGPRANIHDPKGACPNMTDAEWKIVRIGIARSMLLVRRWIMTGGEEQAEKEDAEAERAAAARGKKTLHRKARKALSARWGTYADDLWGEIVGNRLRRPRDIRRANAEIIAYMADRGIYSAAELGEYQSEPSAPREE